MDAIQADLIYYLPEASLTVTATASVVLETDLIDGTVINPTVTQLQLDIKINIQPDTEQLLLINHNSFAFANDELKLTVDNNGLLQTVSVTTEDRIGTVLAQLAQGPKEAVAANRMEFTRDNENIAGKIKTEVKTFTDTFLVTAAELDAGEFSKPWLITLEGVHPGRRTNTIDASFHCKLDGPFAKKQLADGGTYHGLLTRRICKKKMSVFPGAKNTDPKMKPYANYDLFVPDKDTIIKVPINRVTFIKNTSLPKFSAGILVENYINRPSPFEGFLSIPINIAKAFASIPAVIFGFQKNSLSRQKELLDLQTELAKAQLAANTALENVKKLQQTNSETVTKSFLQQKLQQLSLAPLLPAPEQEQPPDSFPQLGKLPPVSGTHATLLPADRKLNTFDLTGQPHPIFTDPGKPFSWVEKLRKLQWNDYNNYNIPDCVPAAAAHMITCWSSNTSQVIIPSFADVKRAYDRNKQSISSGVEMQRGCRLENFIGYWIDPGMGNDKLTTYKQIREKDCSFLTLATYYYGGCLIGLRMPKAVKTMSVDDPWDLPVDQVDFQTGDWTPESWGGHAVPVVGVSGDFFEIISWNRIIRMSARFYMVYNDESHVLLSPNWIMPDGTSPLGGQYNKQFLLDNISTLSKYA